MKYFNPYWIASTCLNYFYQKKMIRVFKPTVPVISIGNLTTGGTGKTPMVLNIIEFLKQNKKNNILVVSKSYRGSLVEPSEIKASDILNTSVFGDEPCLIKSKHPDVHVWSGPNKTQTVQKALEYFENNYIKIDIIIIDDGFSHRRIHRDLDVVLIDTSQKITHYNLLPYGHLREDISQVKRADVVILTKVNNANLETLGWFRSYLNRHSIHYLESCYESKLALEQKNICIFSGIGNPQELETNLNKQGYILRKHVVYKDHHAYSDSDQLFLFDLYQQNQDTRLVTTAKDFIKLTHPELKKITTVVDLEVKFIEDDQKDWHARLQKLI